MQKLGSLAGRTDRAAISHALTHDLLDYVHTIRIHLRMLELENQATEHAASIGEAAHHLTTRLRRLATYIEWTPGPVETLPSHQISSQVRNPRAVHDWDLHEGVCPLSRRDVQTILSELIDNALLHGTPPVTVKSRVDPEGSWCLDVWDHGPGVVDPERAMRLMSTSDPQTRAGVGLALVKRVVEANGGRLQFSKQGDLSRVTVRIAHAPSLRNRP